MNSPKILLLSEYFPPEIGAGSTRAFELCRRWTDKDAEVKVLTGFPDYPDGIIPKPYRGRFLMHETIGKINLVRTFIYPAANKGFIKRVISFFSFTLSSILIGSWATKKMDVIIATSPPFSIGIAGYIISLFKRIPFVFEVRDIWPASVIQLGQIKNKLIIKILEHIELFLYKKAAKIVSVTDSYVEDLVSKGVNGNKIEIIKNGVDLNFFIPKQALQDLKKDLGINGKRIVSYIGTHGLSHALQHVVRCAYNLRAHQDLVFLFVGDGAEKNRIINLSEELKLQNVLFLSSVDKDLLPDYYAISDILLVPLRKIPLFKTVIPSKIFEIMAVQKPLIISVDGEARRLVEKSMAGIYAEPEDPDDLEQKIKYMLEHPDLMNQMGESGRKFVEKYFDRNVLADKYLKLIQPLVDTH